MAAPALREAACRVAPRLTRARLPLPPASSSSTTVTAPARSAMLPRSRGLLLHPRYTARYPAGVGLRSGKLVRATPPVHSAWSMAAFQEFQAVRTLSSTLGFVESVVPLATAEEGGGGNEGEGDKDALPQKEKRRRQVRKKKKSLPNLIDIPDFDWPEDVCNMCLIRFRTTVATCRGRQDAGSTEKLLRAFYDCVGSGFEPDLSTCEALIEALANGGNVHQCMVALDLVVAHGLPLSAQSVSPVLRALEQAERKKESIGVVAKMVEAAEACWEEAAASAVTAEAAASVSLDVTVATPSSDGDDGGAVRTGGDGVAVPERPETTVVPLETDAAWRALGRVRWSEQLYGQLLQACYAVSETSPLAEANVDLLARLWTLIRRDPAVKDSPILAAAVVRGLVAGNDAVGALDALKLVKSTMNTTLVDEAVATLECSVAVGQADVAYDVLRLLKPYEGAFSSGLLLALLELASVERHMPLADASVALHRLCGVTLDCHRGMLLAHVAAGARDAPKMLSALALAVSAAPGEPSVTVVERELGLLLNDFVGSSDFEEATADRGHAGVVGGSGTAGDCAAERDGVISRCRALSEALRCLPDTLHPDMKRLSVRMEAWLKGHMDETAELVTAEGACTGRPE